MSAFRSRTGEWRPGVKALNVLFSALLVFAFIPQAAFAAPSDEALPESAGLVEQVAEAPSGSSFAVSEGDAWDGSVDTSWYNTTDTEFTLTTPAQLAGLAAITSPKSGTEADDSAWAAGERNSRADGIALDNFAGKTVKLGADIDLGGVRWDPISDYNNWREGAGGGAGAAISGTYDGVSWQGAFDGQGHVIKNLAIDGNVHASNNFGGYQGFISGIGPKGLVRNLGIDGGTVFGRVCGGIVGNGNLTEEEAENLVKADWPRIENCWTNLQVAGNGSGSRPSGGIFGGEERGSTGMSVNVVNCYVKGFTTNGQSAGGIVGFTLGEVVGCYNVGTVGKVSNVGSIVSCITVGEYSYADTIDKLYFNNMALVNSCANVYRYKLASDPNNYIIDTTNFKTADQIKAGAASLGNAYVAASEGQNDGYPVLFWQAGQSETSLAEATLSDIPDQIFTGSDIEPAVTVTLGGKTLFEGQDYVLAFSNNRVAGTASVKAVGIGAFTGESAAKTFEIKQINIDEGTIAEIPTQWIYGESATPDLTVKDAFGNTLVQDVDYTVTWANNTDTGTATVTVTGNGTSTYGELSASFKCILASRGLQGSGTEEDPWLIGTKGDFQYFAHMVNTAADPATDPYSTGYYKLTADLDLTAADENDLHADPVARNARVNNRYVEQYFSGVFDGNGHSLTVALDAAKLSSEVTTGRTQVLALFEQVGHPSNGKTAVIKNMTLKGSLKGSPDAPLRTSQIAGFVWGANGTVVLEGLVNEADISNASSVAAGIAGYMYLGSDVTLRNCVNKGTMASNTIAAGVVNNAGGNTAGNRYVLEGCGNEGEVTGARAAGVAFDLMANYNTSGVHFEMTRCYNTGAITATSGYAAGIFGGLESGGTPNNEFSITSCYNTGSITATSYAGGIVAVLNAGASMAIGSCYNTGTVTSTVNNANTGVGGIVGTHGGSAYYYVLDIVDCYNTGTITAGENTRVGSIIGFIGLGATGTKGDVSLENSYYLEGTAAQAVGYVNESNANQAANVVGEPVAKTADEMKAAGDEGMAKLLGASYADDAAEPLNAGFPILWWQAGQERVDASEAVVEAIPDQAFTGLAIIPQGMTATLDGVTLKQGADFTVTCTDNTNVGTANVTLKFIGRYTGTTTATFEIVAADINICTFRNVANQWTMADKAAEPDSAPRSPANRNLVNNTDYVLSYENNVETGTATITWTGIGNWTGTRTAEFKVYQVPSTLEGSGTEADPYLIHDQLELQTTAMLVNSNTGIYPYAFYELANDIDVASLGEDAPAMLTPINNFHGVFDGAGHSITRTDRMINTAPFNVLASGAIVRNLVTEGSIPNAPQQTASIASQVNGTDVLIENCTNNMSIVALSGFCAGFVYELPYNQAGNDVTFRNCVNNADLSSLGNGGVAGFVMRLQYSTARFENCANTGDIVSKSGSNAAFVGSPSGYPTVRYAEIYVDNCYNSGNIQGPSDQGVIAPCPSNTSIYVKNFYNTGDVTIESPYSNNVGAGSVIGFASSRGDTYLELENVYNTGTMSANNAGTRTVFCGAIAGSAASAMPTSSIKNVYFDESTNEAAFGTSVPFDTSGVTGKATVDMKVATFADDLGDAFASDMFGINDGFPVFGWQLPSLDEMLVVPIRSQAYTGSPIEPTITVKAVANGKTVTLPADAFDVIFSDNVDAGTATATLYARAPYQGSLETTFTIAKASLANVTVADIADQVATGEPVEPELTVTNAAGNTLAEGVDYEVAWFDNIEPGNAHGVMIGKGNYTGVAAVGFTIAAGSIEDAEISGIEDSYDYTGEAVALDPTVTLNGRELVEGTDYTVAITDDEGNAVEAPTDKGSYTATFTGIGAFTGTVTKDFSIGTFFSVYVQEGASGEPELVKEFSKADFTALASEGEPVSGMFFKGGAWKVVSTDDYVTVDAILEAAGLSDQWGEGAAVWAGDGGFFSKADWATIQAETNFYPEATAAGSEDGNARTGMPAVIAITGGESVVSTTAGDAETANLASAGKSQERRFLRGITADQLAATNAAGNRYASGCDRLILVVPEPTYLTVQVQNGEGGAYEVAKTYTKSEFEALKSASEDPVSGLFYKGDNWKVTTAATYVTLEDLFADAGVSDLWAPGAQIAYGGDPAQDKPTQLYDYDTFMSMANFYPGSQQATDDTSVAVPAPAVLSLTEFSADTTATQTAGDIEAYNVSMANTTNEPRMVFGVSEEGYLSKQTELVRGMRYWSNVDTVTIIAAPEGGDLADAEVSGVEESYLATGEPIAIEPAVTLGGRTLSEGDDYTVAITDADGNAVDAMVEPGTYTVTVKAAGAYEGEKALAVTLSPYFTVYTQSGDDDPVAAKEYTKAAFEDLRSASEDPVSQNYIRKGTWGVITAATYVTMSDLLDDAGISAYWAEGAGLKAGDGGFWSSATYEEVLAETAFYADFAGDTSDLGEATTVEPVFALTSMSGSLADGQTSADLQAANAAAADDLNAPRFVRGVSAELMASGPGGNRSPSKCNALVIVLTDDSAAAKAVEERIAALPDPEDVAPADEEAIAAAAEALEALTDEQAALVSDGAKAKLAEDQEALEAAKQAAADQAAADAVEAMIDALPAAEDVTLEDADAVNAAAEAFEALTEDQQALVSDEAKAKLEADLAAIDALTAKIERIAGENYANETAAAISSKTFESSEWVIIARDDDYADALGAVGLAGVLDAPIILTDRMGLSDAAAAEIQRLGATKAYIIGGTGAIKDEVDIDLGNIGITVKPRLWGDNSYDTSLACAKEIVRLGGEDQLIITCMSTNFQDALSMSPYAYKYHVPIVLQTWGETSADRGYTEEGKAWLAGKDVIIAGGPGAVSNASLSGLNIVERIYGDTGYDTSQAIADWMVEKGFLSAENVVIACGAQAPKGVDALAGAALAGKLGCPMLLVNGNEAMEAANTATVDGFVTAHASEIRHAYVLGGAYVVPQDLYKQIQGLIEAEDLSA